MKYTNLTSSLPTADLAEKRVFVRADLNVPLRGGVVLSDYKLQKILPTIDAIQHKDGKVILASHIGRPKGRDPELSAAPFVAWFEQQGYRIRFVTDLTQAQDESTKNFREILLLENLRFFPGEKGKDPAFAQQLAQLADFYVNDSFGTCHRDDASLTLLPQLFDPAQRTIGLLVEQELKTLARLATDPEKPFVALIGGGKVKDKLPLLHGMMDVVDSFLLLPAICMTFVKAAGAEVGYSLVDDSALGACKEFLIEAEKRGINVVLPLDYQVAQNTFDGPLSFVDADKFKPTDVAVSIGNKTYELFKGYICNAKTTFFNGLAGTVSRPETLQGVHAVFHAMINCPTYSVIAGGDSVAAAEILKLGEGFDYRSTGGGATLTLLAGRTLPALDVLD